MVHRDKKRTIRDKYFCWRRFREEHNTDIPNTTINIRILRDKYIVTGEVRGQFSRSVVDKEDPELTYLENDYQAREYFRLRAVERDAENRAILNELE